MMRISAVLFDKDGTLFDFQATWGPWALGVLRALCKTDEGLLREIAQALDFDPVTCRFAPESPVIAGTTGEVIDLLRVHLPDTSPEELKIFMDAEAAEARLVPVTPLEPLLEALRQRALFLGVMTNDSESTAYAHLREQSVADFFDFIAGFDSGYGQKPDPDPLLAFARSLNILPEHIVMVGDSTHDLVAARAAGMQAVAVLTGVATAEDLAPFADAVLKDISELPQWIDAKNAKN